MKNTFVLLFMFLKVEWINSVLVMKMEEGDEGWFYDNGDEGRNG